ncbi:MAG TPA: hypothetical protein VL171_12405 [Verrucomicrobiae bacterium]|nr:hypothetical protein [Verrucomicrobiae bacterium]
MMARNLFFMSMLLLPVPAMLAENQAEAIRNDKVLVDEQTLPPGQTLLADRPGALVYLDNGAIEQSNLTGKAHATTVKRGEAVFVGNGTEIRNTGAASLRIVRTLFLGKGGAQTWGTTGLAPDYTLLFENQYARVYDIKMAAGHNEPLHSHHDRVVICLSGAELQHENPDGRRETATLKTGEIVWRKGVTHIGHNLGKTDLWAIAIEPK